jgi:hypothetical protein
MGAEEEYQRIWDLWIEAHRRAHGPEHKAPEGDFNCCAEYGVMLGLRAASAVKADYPSHLLLRIASLPDLDKEFYVRSILATDGEAEPADPKLAREYRTTRRHYILWNELKVAAERIEELERENSRLRAAKATA